MSELYITEVFGPTLQGEGTLAGTMATFIRTAGCTVGCAGCDTKVSWPFGSHPKKLHPKVTIESLVGAVITNDTKYVVLTGGEPLETENPEALTQLLEELTEKLGCHITLELSGSVGAFKDGPLWEQFSSYIDLWSFSPKVASMAPDKLPIAEFIGKTLRANWGRHGQLKFVVDPENPPWGEIEALMEAMAETAVRVPVILQVLTPAGSREKQLKAIAEGPEKLLLKLNQLGRKRWGLWNTADFRIGVQNHVLWGVQ